MMAKLQEAEKSHGFYSSLYRQYSADLMRVTFYVRRILANPKIEGYLSANHREIVAQFREIIAGSPGQEP
jgi:hypothetical protein